MEKEQIFFGKKQKFKNKLTEKSFDDNNNIKITASSNQAYSDRK